MAQRSFEIVLGDAAAEVAAIQLLALTHSQAATWVQSNTLDPVRQTVPAIYLRSVNYMSLVSLGAPQTPLEIIALSARSVFELFVRLRFVLMNDVHARQWRSEAAKDQIEIYESMLTINEKVSQNKEIRSEINRVKKHAANSGLDESTKIMMASDVAKKAGLIDEHRAFYKLYSKLVHPSSFSVNWPQATFAPVYRSALIANIQSYAIFMLDEMSDLSGMPTRELRDNAKALIEKHGRYH